VPVDNEGTCQKISMEGSQRAEGLRTRESWAPSSEDRPPIAEKPMGEREGEEEHPFPSGGRRKGARSEKKKGRKAYPTELKEGGGLKERVDLSQISERRTEDLRGSAGTSASGKRKLRQPHREAEEDWFPCRRGQSNRHIVELRKPPQDSIGKKKRGRAGDHSDRQTRKNISLHDGRRVPVLE